MEENVKNEEKKVEVIDAGIDKDVLEELAKGNILNSLTDETQIRRVELNFLCELLSTFKDLEQTAENLLNILTICSNRQITQFFTGVRDNVKEEQKRQSVKKIVEKSHKKAKKTKNSVK